jgi:hypothetical protein
MNASTKQPCIPAFIAKLAVEFKSAMQTGFTLDDIGIVVGCEVGESVLCDEAFAALVDQVVAALPFVSTDARSVALHRQSARDFNAETRHERRQLGFGA